MSLSAWGLYLFGEDSYRYHTESEYRMVQRKVAFFVPLLQWAVGLLVGLALLVGRREPASSAEPGAASDGGGR